MDGYLAVARRDQVKPDTIVSFRHNGRRYILVEYLGQIYCFDGLCPHAYGPLDRGQLYGKYIYCPYHHSVFDVTTGRPLPGSPTQEALRSYPVKVEGGTVYVKLEV